LTTRPLEKVKMDYGKVSKVMEEDIERDSENTPSWASDEISRDSDGLS